MSAIAILSACLGRQRSLIDQPWNDLEQFQTLSSEVLSGQQPYSVGTQIFESADLGGAHPGLHRLLQYTVRVAHSSGDSQDQMRRLALVVPDYLLRMFVGSPPASPGQGELADGHVHFGGAVSESSVLNSMLRSDDLGMVGDTSFTDLSGATWRLDWLLLHLKRLVIASQFGATDEDPRLSTYWEGLALAPESRPDAGWRNLNGWRSEWRSSTLKVDHTDLDVRSLASILSVGSAIGWDATAINSAMVLLCLFHVAIASPERSSLDRFVDGFERVSKLSKIGMEKDERFASAVDWAGAGLRRLELRKTYVSSSSAAADIRDDLDCLLKALRRPETDVDLRVQMPLTFHKGDTLPEALHRFNVQDQLDLAEVFASVLADGGVSLDERAMVASLDVVGREQAQPNWIYCFALNHVEARLAALNKPNSNGEAPLTLSAHAGETSATPLEGLRAITEYVDHVPHLRRIGHGLSLGVEYSKKLASLWSPHSVPAAVVLDDLLWARSHLSAEIQWQYDSILLALGNCVIPTHNRDGRGATWTVGALQLWYLLRFDLNFLRNHLGFDGVRGPESPRLQGYTSGDRDLAYAAFTIYMSRSPKYLQWATLGDVGTLTADEKASLGRIEIDLYEAIRPQTVSKIRNRSIQVEICPSSNCALLGIEIADHPLLPHLSEFECTVNTDDPVIFGRRVLDELNLFGSRVDAASLDEIRLRGLRSTAREILDDDYLRVTGRQLAQPR